MTSKDTHFFQGMFKNIDPVPLFVENFLIPIVLISCVSLKRNDDASNQHFLEK